MSLWPLSMSGPLPAAPRLSPRNIRLTEFAKDRHSLALSNRKIAGLRSTPDPQRKGQRREAADDDVRFVSARNGCLPFAPAYALLGGMVVVL